MYLGSDYHIPTYFSSLNTNLNSENIHHPPLLSKSPKKLHNSENRQEPQFHFENRYITNVMHLDNHYLYIYTCRT